MLASGTFHARAVGIWDLEGKDDKPVLLHEEKFAASANVAFSPDGRSAVIHDGDGLAIHDEAAQAQCRNQCFAGLSEDVTCAGFHEV